MKLKSALVWLRPSPAKFLVTALMSGVLFFFPDHVLASVGLLEIRQSLLSVIAGAFLLSIALLLGEITAGRFPLKGILSRRQRDQARPRT